MRLYISNLQKNLEQETLHIQAINKDYAEEDKSTYHFCNW